MTMKKITALFISGMIILTVVFCVGCSTAKIGNSGNEQQNVNGNNSENQAERMDPVVDKSNPIMGAWHLEPRSDNGYDNLYYYNLIFYPDGTVIDYTIRNGEFFDPQNGYKECYITVANYTADGESIKYNFNQAKSFSYNCNSDGGAAGQPTNQWTKRDRVIAGKFIGSVETAADRSYDYQYNPENNTLSIWNDWIVVKRGFYGDFKLPEELKKYQIK